MTQKEFESIITPFIDEKYKEGSVRITKTKLYTYGLRTPVMRKLSKRLFDHRPDFIDFFYSKESYSFEEVMLAGMQLIYEKDEGLLVEKLKKLIPRFDSWAHTDQIIVKYKCVNDYFCFLKSFEYLKTGTEFEKRSYAIMLLKECGNLNSYDLIIKELQSIEQGCYYVDMAIAWTLAEMLSKDYDNIVKNVGFLNSFSVFILKKAAQKCRDSFRLTAEQKKYITELVNNR